jgi:hypothetical protein
MIQSERYSGNLKTSLIKKAAYENSICCTGECLGRIFGFDPIFNYNVLATPHIAGSTDISMEGIVKVVAENIHRIDQNLEPLYLK